ncbi:MAG: hypothetical protein KGJ93_04675 [Patescibacteria group bacterium]|nr:hypothetical protein [Patescibacteria group bacterium]
MVTLKILHLGLWSDTHRAVRLGLIWIPTTAMLDWLLGLYSAEEMGLVWKKSRQTGWVVELAVFIASAMFFSGLFCGTARASVLDAFLFQKTGLLVGALAQQFLVESYVFVRLERVVGNKAPLAAAAVFSLAHWPNRTLVLITFTGGLASSLTFK